MLTFLRRLLHFIEDPHCMMCGAPLDLDEYGICSDCISNSGIFDAFQLQVANNPMERRLHGSRISAASALMSYDKGKVQQRLIHNLKYNNQPRIAITLGRAIALKITRSLRYQNIDYIIPVPLHPRKQRKRGYNQSELIASEIARITHIPLITDQLSRLSDNQSQATMSLHDRMKAEITFHVKEPSLFEGKSILLIDDVFTTGSTIINCAKAFDNVQDMIILLFAVASPLGH